MSNSNSNISSRPWLSHYGSQTNKELMPYEYTNLTEMIYKSSQQWDSKIAFTFALPNGLDGSLTFNEVNELSDYFAVYLKEELKLKEGDRVLLQMPNCLAYPICVFGILKAGGVLVNTNPLYTPTEMNHQFSDAQAKILIIIDMFADKLEEALENTNVEHIVLVSIADLMPFLKKTLVKTILKYVKKQIPNCPVNYVYFEQCLNVGEKLLKEKNILVNNYWNEISLSHLCALQYTGGTTGVSKGAMLTHENILSNMYQIHEMGRSKVVPGAEYILTALPLYHIFAFTVNLIFMFKVGTTNILIPNPRPLENLKKAFEKYPISWISGVNTLFNGLLNESWFTENPPRNLKASIAGGASLHSSVATRWKNITHTSVVEGYGLTETSPVVSFNPIDGRVKPETIGIPVPGTDVCLFDENGKEVDIGQPGEIGVKGPQVMKGYWQHPEETQKVFHNGWLLTGDIAVMDTDGYLKIIDRKKDMILVSGFNVFPNEVEDCISKMPSVQEVAVVGIPNEATGEMVKAFVVEKDESLTQEQIVEHCKQYLTHYKLPKKVEFRSELPKSPIGKILRKNLRNS